MRVEHDHYLIREFGEGASQELTLKIRDHPQVSKISRRIGPTSRMRRAQITGKDAPLAVNNYAETYKAPPEGVLVKTHYAGLCHTDLHFLMADDVMEKRCAFLGDDYIGITPGHETSGVIEAFGDNVCPEDHGLSIGDRVCIFPWVGCEGCTNCTAGDSHVCEDNRFGTTEIGQGLKPGGFASHVPVNNCKYVVKVPDNVPMDIACMLPCSAVTALNALNKTKVYVERAQQARGIAKLLVSGAGGVGLWAVQIAKFMYRDQKVDILVADIGEDRLETARQYGATTTVLWDPKADQATNIKATREVAPDGLDAIVDFVNNPMTVGILLGTLRTAGTLVACGFFGGTFQLPLPMVVARTVAIQGSRVAPLGLLRELVEMAATANFSYPCLEYYNLNDVNEAVTKMKGRKIKGRALFKF